MTLRLTALSAHRRNRDQIEASTEEIRQTIDSQLAKVEDDTITSRQRHELDSLRAQLAGETVLQIEPTSAHPSAEQLTIKTLTARPKDEEQSSPNASTWTPEINSDECAAELTDLQLASIRAGHDITDEASIADRKRRAFEAIQHNKDDATATEIIDFWMEHFVDAIVRSQHPINKDAPVTVRLTQAGAEEIARGCKIPVNFNMDAEAKARHTEIIDTFLKQGFVELCDHGAKYDPDCCYSPIFTIRQGTAEKGKWRLVYDARRLNKLTADLIREMDSIETIVGAVCNSRYACTSDISTAFCCIDVEESSRKLLRFVGPDNRIMQFKRLPFGLKNRLVDRTDTTHKPNSCPQTKRKPKLPARHFTSTA
jgi:hypothetical protein